MFGKFARTVSQAFIFVHEGVCLEEPTAGEENRNSVDGGSDEQSEQWVDKVGVHLQRIADLRVLEEPEALAPYHTQSLPPFEPGEELQVLRYVLPGLEPGLFHFIYNCGSIPPRIIEKSDQVPEKREGQKLGWNVVLSLEKNTVVLGDAFELAGLVKCLGSLWVLLELRLVTDGSALNDKTNGVENEDE